MFFQILKIFFKLFQVVQFFNKKSLNLKKINLKKIILKKLKF